MIRNIIFDLGNVIINIDEQTAAKRFANLGFNVAKFYNSSGRHEIFDLFETGKVDEHDFLATLAQQTDKSVTPVKIKQAWNTVLLDIPPERIEFIQELSKNHDC